MFLRYVSYLSKLCFSNVPWAHFCKTFLGHISWVRFSKQKRLVSWPSCFTQRVSWTQMRASSLQKQQRGQHRHTEASSRKYCREKSLGLPQKYQRWHSENTKERHPKGKTPPWVGPWVKHSKQDRHQKAPERKHNKNRYCTHYENSGEKKNTKKNHQKCQQHNTKTPESEDNTEKYRQANATEKGRSAPCPGASKIKAPSHKKSICHRFQHAKLNNVCKADRASINYE